MHSLNGMERVCPMNLAARALVGIAALIGSAPAAGAAVPGYLSPNWSDPIYLSILAGLTVIALAIIAAMVAFARERRAVALFRDIFSAIPQPRQVVDADGKTLFANAAFYDFFAGVNKATPDLLIEEVAGDGEALDQLRRITEGARNGVAGYTELQMRPRAGVGGERPALAGGSPEWRYVSAYPIAGRPGAVLWMVDDITLRRQMEQVVEEEQARFVDRLESAPVGVYSVDSLGRFLFANRTFCDWLGRRPEDLNKGTLCLHDIIAGELPDSVPPYVPFSEPGATHGDVLLKDRGDGGFQAAISQDIITGVDGRVLRTRSVVQNLSRDREVAEALERSAQRFERIFAEAPVGIAQLDREGRLSQCNRAFVALVDRPAEELSGKLLFDLVQPDDRDAVRQALRASPGDSATRAPVQARLEGGRETICALFAARITNHSGAVTGFIVHFIDMSEQKSLEVQFAQSQKMQAVGQLAGGIAHDFNNLLTAMIGFADLLLLRHRPGDPSFADIDQIKQNANRAADLVRQLLAFSRQQTLLPRILNVTDVLAELSHLLRRLIGADIDLEMIHGRDVGAIKADQGQLEQVITNLAVNARDAMPRGGKLSIRTGNVTIAEERRYQTETMPPGNYVIVEVEDTGSGISPNHLERIFEPFFSTKAVGEGTGLGLSTVYGIVKQTGGFVTVDSVLGQGTVFSIYLPQTAEEAEASAVPNERIARASPDHTGMGTILFVEDEDAVRAVGARALRNKGYDVLEADSGESALEILRDRGEGVDLLVTDVVMPRVDGPTLVRQLRSSRPDLKVIFISGYAEDTFRNKLGEGEWVYFLPKPFNLKQLAGKVKEVMDANVPSVAAAARPDMPEGREAGV